MLLVKRLSERATLPTRGSMLSAGLDLYSAEKKLVPAGGKALVKTDIAIKCPEEDGPCYARIAPRSGLAWKKSIDVGAGVVDADYRGNVGVILFNLGKEDFEVDIKDRIAQLIVEKISYPAVQEVEELDATERGAGGFGSTGVNDRENSNNNAKDAEQPKKRRKVEKQEQETVELMKQLLIESKVMVDENIITPEEQGKLKWMILAEHKSMLAAARAHATMNDTAELHSTLKAALSM